MIFFFIFLAVLAIIYIYPGRRVLIPLSGSFSRYAWFFLLFLLTLPVFHILTIRYQVSPFLSDITGWAGYTALGFISLLFLLTFIRDIFLVPQWLKRKWQQLTTSSPEEDKKQLSRRKFLYQGTNMGITALSLSATSYGFFKATKSPDIIHQKITLENLPLQFQGFTILQLSDIHVGATIKRDFIERLVRQCNELQPDVITLTGDLVDGSVAHLGNDTAPLKALHAPCGKFFVTGNHEYYSGAKEWIREVQRLGFTVLMNEHQIIRRDNAELTLAGVTDYRGGMFYKNHRSDPFKAVEGAPPESVKILLAHQPKSIYEAAEAGVDLQLSGHTHGGQYFPGNLLVKLDQPFVAGLYHYGKSQLV